MARVPTTADYNVVPKLEALYKQWRALLKGKSRRSEPQTAKDDLFDIADADALSMIRNNDDKEFLLAQREKGRRGYMAAIDQNLVKKEDAKCQRQERYERFRSKTMRPAEIQDTEMDLEQTSSTSSGISETDKEPKETKRVNPKKRGRLNIVTKALSAALDRSQVSDRSAVHVLSATAASLGHDPQQLAINRSSIRRRRMQARKSIAEEIKDSFSPGEPLIVHWDGKILPDLTGNSKVDRLPVLVSGGKVSKLLGVPCAPSGTGEAAANAVITCLEEWGLKDRIKALSFDTTAANTGIHNGACILIEKKLGKNLLNLACRHHIMELVISSVFEECYKLPSNSPNIQIFQRFKENWENINQQSFQIIDEHEQLPVPVKKDTIEFCKEQLISVHPRDDYRELLELVLIYLGEVPTRRTRFLKPGALHRARWMSRIIYALKICLFRSQFPMSKSDLKGMLRFAKFVVSVYVRQWFLAPVAAYAPFNDLQFLEKLHAYDDKKISDVAVTTLSRHLWYLSETLVSLSFFDSRVDDTVKRKMVISLKKESSDRDPLKRLHATYAEKSVLKKSLDAFVTRSSLHFFNLLDIPTEFLLFDPAEWPNREDYQKGLNYVRHMKVVNDFAERGVALIQSYNRVITKNEDQKQYLLQVVEQHRRLFPDAKKATVTSSAIE